MHKVLHACHVIRLAYPKMSHTQSSPACITSHMCINESLCSRCRNAGPGCYFMEINRQHCRLRSSMECCLASVQRGVCTSCGHSLNKIGRASKWWTVQEFISLPMWIPADMSMSSLILSTLSFSAVSSSDGTNQSGTRRDRALESFL